MKKIKKFILMFIIIASICCSSLFASSDSRVSTSLSTSYYSENYLHPGGKLGIDFLFENNSRHKLFMGVNIGSVVFAPFYTSAFLKYDIGYCFSLPFGLDFTAGLGAGYKHLFLMTDVYGLSNGTITELNSFGQPLFFTAAHGGVIFTPKVSTALPIGFFIEYGISAEGPFNRVLLFHPVLEAGLKISLDNSKK